MKTTERCDCKNCRHVERQKRLVMKACRPTGKGVTDHHVFMWNETLRLFPCLNKKED